MNNIYAPHKEIRDTRLVVAMSGGVDSSTVAAMLYKQGYEVVGITLQLYDHGVAIEKKGACCAGQDIHDARKVANMMGFPHYVLNYESIFKQNVMNDFADSYLRGETPIPCVRCNQKVKFKDLFKVAKDLGADALITGHYAQKIIKDGKSELHIGADLNKDQSYFLFATTQDQLNYIHFPLGGMKKEDTRKLAIEMGLEIADKPDSQDICFVPNGNYASVVERLRPGALDAGNIVDMNGNILGQHNGIINYTVGQRKGIGISMSEPIYVIKIDPDKKEIIVGPRSALKQNQLFISEVNWLYEKIHDYSNDNFITANVKLRSMSKSVSAHIYPLVNNRAKVELIDNDDTVSPGQACVIYQGSRVIGGGWIERKD